MSALKEIAPIRHDEVECLPDEVWPIGKKAALYSCLIVFCLGAFDFIDRQVLAALLPYIKNEWQVSDTQLGMLVSVVNVVMAILVVPSAYFIDRWSRKKMICIMGTVWSLATAACAFAGSFTHLFVARVFIGAGEAGYNPAAQALLSAQFPKKYRGTAIGLTQLGISIGAPLGLVIGAYIATHWGWRHAFGVVAVPGFILALLALLIRDYKSVAVTADTDKALAPSATGDKVPYKVLLARLLRTPSLLCVYFGAIMMMMHGGAIMNWTPSYFHREGGMPLTQASGTAALILVGVMVSTLLVGPLIDAVRKRFVNAAPLVLACGLSMATCLLFLGYGVLTPGSAPQIAVLVMAGLGTGVSATGGSIIIIDLVHPGARATAVSLMIFCQNILGFAIGPVVAGFLSDHFSLGTALLLLTVAPLLSALSYIMCNFTYKRDLAKVACVNLDFDAS